MTRGNPIPLLALLSVAVACSDAPVTSPVEEDLNLHVADGFVISHSESPVLTFADLKEVGVSTLARTQHGVSAYLSTSELGARTAATMWAVIFNNPGACTDPCDEDDVAPGTDAAVDVVWFDGGIVGPSGSRSFQANYSNGDNTGSLFAALGAPAPGLVDSRTAEVHLIIRTHGKWIPELITSMLKTFNGGCTHPAGFPDPLPPELGVPGPNTCEDIQFAVHKSAPDKTVED